MIKLKQYLACFVYIYKHKPRRAPNLVIYTVTMQPLLQQSLWFFIINTSGTYQCTKAYRELPSSKNIYKISVYNLSILCDKKWHNIIDVKKTLQVSRNEPIKKTTCVKNNGNICFCSLKDSTIVEYCILMPDLKNRIVPESL